MFNMYVLYCELFMLLYTLSKILKRNKIQCPDIGMCFGELPSVNDTLFSWPKRSHRFIEPPLFRAGFAIPEGAPLCGDHCNTFPEEIPSTSNGQKKQKQ